MPKLEKIFTEALTKLSLDVFSRVVGNTNEKLDAAKDMGKSMAIKYGLDLAFAKGKAKGNNNPENDQIFMLKMNRSTRLCRFH